MERQEHPADFAFTLLTFLIYAASMLMLVYMGTGVYRHVTAQLSAHDEARTVQSYITEKVRQNDRAGAVRIGIVEDHEALLLGRVINEQEFLTYIYEDEGYLKEQLMKADHEPQAAQGTKLCAVKELKIEQTEERMMQITFTDEDGKKTTFALHTDCNIMTDTGAQDSLSEVR